jgi:hypothetical protein
MGNIKARPRSKAPSRAVIKAIEKAMVDCFAALVMTLFF